MILILWIAALLHPVHETVAEVEWNANTNRMEIALRLDALDEEWLMKSFQAEAEPSTFALKHLANRFQVSDQPSFPKEDAITDAVIGRQYHWVGRKADGAYVWWYFEIEPAKPQRPKWIRQRMFFQRDERYTNRVIVLDRKPRLAVTLTADKPIASLDTLDDEPTADDTAKEPKS